MTIKPGDRIVPNHTCPDCGAKILYNGNYFCSDCEWVNPAVFLGKFTIAEADFADSLIEALTGRPSRENLQEFASDRRRSRGSR